MDRKKTNLRVSDSFKKLISSTKIDGNYSQCLTDFKNAKMICALP